MDDNLLDVDGAFDGYERIWIEAAVCLMCREAATCAAFDNNILKEHGDPVHVCDYCLEAIIEKIDIANYIDEKFG